MTFPIHSLMVCLALFVFVPIHLHRPQILVVLLAWYQTPQTCWKRLVHRLGHSDHVDSFWKVDWSDPFVIAAPWHPFVLTSHPLSCRGCARWKWSRPLWKSAAFIATSCIPTASAAKLYLPWHLCRRQHSSTTSTFSSWPMQDHKHYFGEWFSSFGWIASFWAFPGGRDSDSWCFAFRSP